MDFNADDFGASKGNVKPTNEKEKLFYLKKNPSSIFLTSWKVVEYREAPSWMVTHFSIILSSSSHWHI